MTFASPLKYYRDLPLAGSNSLLSGCGRSLVLMNTVEPTLVSPSRERSRETVSFSSTVTKLPGRLTLGTVKWERSVM